MSRLRAIGLIVGRRLVALVILLFAITTLLFFLLRLSGDPAAVLAGEQAAPDQVAAIRALYGLDAPLPVQYLRHLRNVALLDFGQSLQAGRPAIDMVAERLGSTLILALLALTLTAALAIPIGTWLGAQPEAPSRRAGSAVIFILQGMPGYIVGLLLIQLLAVELRLLPSIGNRGAASWVLPTLTLASFLVPKLSRVLAANVGEAMREDFIRTARANGATTGEAVLRHALPNALLGATALVGTQFAFLMSGAVITEWIFAWPGFGQLLIQSLQRLDFPVVQASVFVTAGLVFAVNAGTDVLFRLIDPRLRSQSA
jgi:peptide/nickel transport system permease protein